MQKIKNFIKRKKKLSLILGGIFLIIILVLLFGKKNTEEQTIIAKLGDFKNQVSVSGKVVPASSVDLAFKNSGRIERIYFSMDESAQNKIIKAGTLIAQIEAKEARKALQDAEIDLANAQLSLAKLELSNSEENMNSDLEKSYDDGFITASNAFLDLSSTLISLENILEDQDLSDNLVRNSGQTALNYKNDAEKLFYNSKSAFNTNQKNFRLLNRNSSNADIEKIINETHASTRILIDALKSTKNLVDYLAEDTGNEDNYTNIKETLSSSISEINGHLSNLALIRKEIKDNKDIFQNTDLDTQSLLLTIKQKENDLRNARAELEDYYIRAPFDGIITKIEGEVGEIVSSNSVIVSMMSVGTFQIESYIPEVNIALVKLNDEATITLDAYGDQVTFLAKVVSIDPAETIKDGVSTYKIKLQFMEKDDRILSGMTANVLIVAVNKPNVIIVPQGVIFEQENKKFVQIKKDKKYLDTEVLTGEISSLGQVEIISGINDGDEIVLNPQIK